MQNKSLNPFIHGTSSETLSMMQHTNFQLMPILRMLEDFKIAPMVGELTQGGFNAIGDDSNYNSFIGAPAFGEIHSARYSLNNIINSYTAHDKISKNKCKANFKASLTSAPQQAFSNLNLLMIYLVQVRQLGIKISDIVPLDDIEILKERLKATIQFYYFILCIQKHIFINVSEIRRLKEENHFEGEYFFVGDYMEHHFSFEKLLEKIIMTQFNVKKIYRDPSKENINKLIEFLKIRKDVDETVKKYPNGEYNFTPQRDYYFFTEKYEEPTHQISHEEIGGYFFSNTPGYSFPEYLEKYYKSYNKPFELEPGEKIIVLPHFQGFHDKIMSHITALKDRIQLCYALLEAHDNEFILYDMNDDLVTHPFPVVFVTEANTIEKFHQEHRSRSPLQLGKEITLVATDNKANQKRLRNYLQKNGVVPVEVLLFNDLYALKHFNPLSNPDLITACNLAKEKGYEKQFSELYYALSELNEKRYRFKSTNKEVYSKLNALITDLQANVLTPDKTEINFSHIRNTLERHKQGNYALYATHRGILGTIDTILTIIASLVIFYPIIYLVQKNRKSPHTFFSTDTEEKIENVLIAAENINKFVSNGFLA